MPSGRCLITGSQELQGFPSVEDRLSPWFSVLGPGLPRASCSAWDPVDWCILRGQERAVLRPWKRVSLSAPEGPKHLRNHSAKEEDCEQLSSGRTWHPDFCGFPNSFCLQGLPGVSTSQKVENDLGRRAVFLPSASEGLIAPSVRFFAMRFF